MLHHPVVDEITKCINQLDLVFYRLFIKRAEELSNLYIHSSLKAW
jgi:hypothetical protein